VTQTIRLTNRSDEEAVNRGHLTSDRIRTTIIDALVDTGATMMVLWSTRPRRTRRRSICSPPPDDA
jgi:predicted aspartyl protease